MERKFVGRQDELEALQVLTRKQAASLVVVTGRRRIGKSRLIDEFARRNKRYKRAFISALAPQPGIGASEQREGFARQLELAVGLPPVKHDSWLALFTHLARATDRGRWIILLDEVSWMAGGDPRFLPELKVVWDQQLAKNPQLILVLCGSVSSWLDRNILSSTGFVGRVSLHLRVGELPLRQCNKFWSQALASAYDRLKLLAVTGGVPRYLEEIVVSDSADANVRRLCFTPEGLLFREFDQIFSDLFERRAEIYRDIVRALQGGHKSLKELFELLDRKNSGVLSTYLEELAMAGFVRREHTWSLHSRSTSKLSRFRLSDNYLRFYLHYILPNRERIESRRMGEAPLTALTGWDGLMALQFENLVLQNRQAIWEACGLAPSEIELEGPFFQTATRRRRGCQIDYLIQTRGGPVYVCEIKLSRKRIGVEVEDEVRQKIERLKLPKHCSPLPVLVHANEVTDSLQYGGFFARVVDFRRQLETAP
ncbi:ATP-binding protein [Planctomycetota bacterium]